MPIILIKILIVILIVMVKLILTCKCKRRQYSEEEQNRDLAQSDVRTLKTIVLIKAQIWYCNINLTKRIESVVIEVGWIIQQGTETICDLCGKAN